MLNPSHYANAAPEGFSLLEIRDNDGGRLRKFVPLKRTELKGEVAGPIAALELTQTFGFARGQSDKTIEAAYRFPLPGDAAVHDVRVRFGDVAIRAELMERSLAERDYQSAKAEGRQAALATRESPDVFTLLIAGIAPDQDVTINTRFTQLAKAEGEQFTLRVPLTTAPRYVRDDEAGSRNAEGQPLALARDPGHRFALDLSLRGVEAVESKTHDLDVVRNEGRVQVRLRAGEVVPDRDCVLAWRPRREADQPVLDVIAHDDPTTGSIYFLAQVAPPARRDPGKGVPREVVLLVDHSGSMEGAKWQAADWAVIRFLTNLGGRDRFALGLFHNKTFWFRKGMTDATPEAVNKAIEYLKAHRDSGGTELGVALEQALGLPRGSGPATRHVLVVTDAEVSDSDRILRLVEKETSRADRRRVSVLCIDAAPNALLANEMAERGGGVARFLTSSPESEDITTALDDILEDWAEPVLSGLRLEIDRPGVESTGRTVGGRTNAIDLGDLPCGRTVWEVGRVPRGETGAVAFQLVAEPGRPIASARLGTVTEHPAGRALRSLFGAKRVLRLEQLRGLGRSGAALQAELRRLGYDPAQVFATEEKVYAENARSDEGEALRRLLVRESLAYGIACAETAFVAARSEAGRQVEGQVIVPNAMPQGWDEGFLGAMPGRGMAFRSAAPVRSRGSSGYGYGAPLRSGGGYGYGADPTMDFDDLELDDRSQLAPPSAVPTASGNLRAKGGSGLVGALRSFFAPPQAAPAPVAAAPAPTAAPDRSAVVFSGIPGWNAGVAVLLDTSVGSGKPPFADALVFSRLVVAFPDGTDGSALDSGLALELYVDDLATPKARVRLVDLVRQGGGRPLNVQRRDGRVVKLILVDPNGAWAASAPRMEVRLEW